MLNINQFRDRRIVLTGGASGIGRATTEFFSKAGAQVFVLDVNEDSLKELVSLDGVVTHTIDISDRSECQKAIKMAIKELSGIDVLANIAGIFKAHKATKVTEKEWDSIISINLSGTFWMCQAAIPHLLESRGCIVNIASTAGYMGQAYTVPYCASKGGVILLTKSLAMEYAKTPVRINAIAPGGVDTALTQGFSFPDDVDFDLVARYSGFRGMSEPQDIAEAIAFLSSDSAKRIHGTILNVDAGVLAG